MNDLTSSNQSAGNSYLVDELVGTFQYSYLVPSNTARNNVVEHTCPAVQLGSLTHPEDDLFAPLNQNDPHFGVPHIDKAAMTNVEPLATSGESQATSQETDTSYRTVSIMVRRDTDVPYRVSTPVGLIGNIRGLEASMRAPGSVPKPIFGEQFVVQIPAESVGVPMLEVERTGLSTAPPTWTALPHWSMRRLFNDSKEAKLAENFQYNTALAGIKRSPLFVGPGLRYIPSEKDRNSNIYRTVVVEGLPPWVTVHEVLSRVEGGKIESAILADTTSIMGGYPTMMIRFVLQSGAQEFLRRTHGAVFLGYWPTQVRQVGTPTYTLSEEMDKQINQWGRTRCLKVHSEHLELRGYLRQVLHEPDWVEWIEFTLENVLAGTSILHFTSIKMAIVAYDILRLTQQFSPADLEFCHDPCAV